MYEPLSYIHIKRKTPGPAVFLQGILTVVFLALGDIQDLIEFASFLIWFFYGSACVCLIVMRKTHAYIPRSYKVPIILPIITLCVSLFLGKFYQILIRFLTLIFLILIQCSHP